MLWWSLVAAGSFGLYFYRLARIYQQNGIAWGIVGVLAFLVGEATWLLLFGWFLGRLLYSIIDSIDVLAYVYLIGAFAAGSLVAVWARNRLVRQTQMTPGAMQPGV